MTAALRLSLFYAGYFCGTGVQLPYWPVWLASRGLSAGEIGALLAISQWIKVAANPLVGMLADRAGERRRFMAMLAGVTVAAYLLCLPAHGFAALLVPSVLAAASAAALLPLGDTLALAAGPVARVDYGRVRLWGTVAFILMTLAAGRALSGRSADLILDLLLATALLTALSCPILPRVAVTTRDRSPRDWHGLVARDRLVFLAAAALIQSSHAVYYAFGTLYWQRLGYSDAVIAWLWAEGAIAEVALFYFGAGLVARCGPLALMALGGGAAAVRWGATAFVTSLPALVVVQPLHAMSFGAAHLGAMHYLARHTPPERAATAQSLYSATVNGVGFGLAALAAGALYAAFAGGAYIAMAAMAALGAALAGWLGRKARYLR